MAVAYVYEIKVNKYNSNEEIECFHIAAEGQLEAAHIADTIVYELYSNDHYKNTPVEIVSVSRIVEIKSLVNINLTTSEKTNEDTKDPFDVNNIPADDLISFKHTCDTKITVADGWNSIRCPKCNEEISREEVQNMHGIWVYIPSENRKKYS